METFYTISDKQNHANFCVTSFFLFMYNKSVWFLVSGTDFDGNLLQSGNISL